VYSPRPKPHGPPNLILVSFTSKFTGIFTSITSKFANILGLGIACELITLFVIFFHAIILPDYRFFFEVPRIEELQDPDSSPRREEVGRRTLGEYGGFLLPFFCRARFSRVDEHYSKTFELGSCYLIGLQSPREWKNRTRLDECCFFYYLIPSREDII
jgi:hypothetical protein